MTKAISDRTAQLDRIAELLREQSTLSLATVDEAGIPSVAPLFYIVDTDLNFYWLSSAGSEHSRNLHREPNVAVAVYPQTDDWKEIRGVQIRGVASAVADPARLKVLVKNYCERFQMGGILRLAIARSTLYEFKPRSFRLLDNSKGFGYRFELTRE
jgi:uncharacterized protein YhbP (UPF0306 family)